MRITDDTRRVKGRLGLALVIACVLGVIGVIWQSGRRAPARQHIARGVELMNQGQNSAAEAQWRAAVRLDPNSFEAWQLLGSYYARAGDCAAARPALERAVEIDSGAAAVSAQLAGCEFQLQDYQAARGHAQNALKQRPADVKLLQLSAQIADKLGDRAARLKHLQRLVELQPKDGAALRELAKELQFRKEYDRAIPIAERLVALEPNSASAHFTRGTVLLAATSDPADLQRAQTDFQRALQLEPGNLEARRGLARAYVLLDKPRLAIEQFEAIGRGRPWVSAHLFELANAYRSAGDSARADEVLTRFTSVREFNVNALELANSIKRYPQNAEPVLKLGLWFMGGLEENADDAMFQLYRYRYLRGEWYAVDYYLDKARQLALDDAKVRAATEQLEKLSETYLAKSRKALQRGDEAAAKNAMAHALLLRPNAAATRAVMRQFEARGLEPLGSLPDAA